MRHKMAGRGGGGNGLCHTDPLLSSAPGSPMPDAPAPRPLVTPAQFDEVLAAPLALVYKHSNRCPISTSAMHEVQALLEKRPDAPVWIVDVNVQRALSREVADRTGVTHESPQAILLSHGEVLWDASHFDVRADALARELDAAGEEARGAAGLG